MKKIFLFALIVLVLFLTKLSALNLPFSEDSLTYLIPSSEYMIKNNFTLLTGEIAFGHMPLLFILSSIIFLFTMKSLYLHIIILLLASLALFLTYLISKKIFDEETGIIAVILLLTTPAFFSLSAIFSTAIPSTALNLAAIYFTLKDNKKLYLLMMVLAILVYESSFLIIPGILVYVLIKNYNENKKLPIKELFIYSSPILIIPLWLILNKILYGWFFHEELNRFRLTNIYNIAMINLRIVKLIFFDNFRWLLTSFLILSPITLRLFFRRIRTRKVIFPLLISLLFLFVLSFVPLFNLEPSIFPTFYQHFKEIYALRFLLASILFIFLLTYNFFFEEYNKKEVIMFGFIILTYVFYHSLFRTNAERYFLPVYPLFIIIASGAIKKLFVSTKYIVTIIIALLFVLSFNPHLSYHGDLSSNMEYADEIYVESQAINYIQENYATSKILIFGFPSNHQLSSPYAGYTKIPLNTIDIQNLEDGSEFDIFYYTGLIGEETKQEILKKYNLVLEKRFEKNNKYTEIYFKSNS